MQENEDYEYIDPKYFEFLPALAFKAFKIGKEIAENQDLLNLYNIICDEAEERSSRIEDENPYGVTYEEMCWAIEMYLELNFNSGFDRGVRRNPSSDEEIKETLEKEKHLLRIELPLSRKNKVTRREDRKFSANPENTFIEDIMQRSKEWAFYKRFRTK